MIPLPRIRLIGLQGALILALPLRPHAHLLRAVRIGLRLLDASVPRAARWAKADMLALEFEFCVAPVLTFISPRGEGT